MGRQLGGVCTVQAEALAIAGFASATSAGRQRQGQAGGQQGVPPGRQGPQGCPCGRCRGVGQGTDWEGGGRADWQQAAVNGSQRFCGHRTCVLRIRYSVQATDSVTFLSLCVTNGRIRPLSGQRWRARSDLPWPVGVGVRGYRGAGERYGGKLKQDVTLSTLMGGRMSIGRPRLAARRMAADGQWR